MAKKAGSAAAEEPARKTMYGQVTVLNNRDHADLTLGPLNDHRHAAHLNAVAIAAAELPQAAMHYPIVFGEHNGVWSAYAVAGPRAEHNAFIGPDGAWLPGHYVPALVRRYPFILVGSPESGRLSLAADLEAECLKGSDGQRIYEGGKPTRIADNILRFCLSFDEQMQVSGVLFKRIADAGIFVDRQAKVTLPSGETSQISGFAIVDEKKLSELPDEIFLTLRANGVLNLIFCHLWSMRGWENILQ
ncbi:SapC family protein [Tepidamorphus sp. 3E244]|uniref:SapC family protein n=1 Tax=Tepidamorphus sp. 3E244 TaxID=3385498 RepID=UPI0038FC3F4C